MLLLPLLSAASASEDGAAAKDTHSLLLFSIRGVEGVTDEAAAQIEQGLRHGLSKHESIAAAELSPELPAVKRAIAEKTVAPEALELLTSPSAREVLCRALDYEYGLIVETLTSLPGSSGRTGVAATATLLRTDGGKPRVLRSVAETSTDQVSALSSAELVAVGQALADTVAAAVVVTVPDESADPAVKVRALTQQAADHMAVGKYRLAAAAYTQALRFQPRNADLYFRLGNAHASAGKLDSAIVAYRQSLYLQGNNQEALVALAKTYQRLDELDSFLDTTRKLVKAAPDVAEHQRLLGEALTQRRKALLRINSRQEADLVFNEAREAYRRAIELSDDKLGILKPYAKLLFEDGEFSAALGFIRDALALQPEDAELRTMLWQCLLLSRQYEQALEELLAQMTADPELRLTPDDMLYRKLAVGIDRLARQWFIDASETRSQFFAEKLTREQFLLSTRKFLTDTEQMLQLLDHLTPPNARQAEIHTARQHAFHLMGQWALNERTYIETLEAKYSDRAVAYQKRAAAQFDTVHQLEGKAS